MNTVTTTGEPLLHTEPFPPDPVIVEQEDWFEIQYTSGEENGINFTFTPTYNLPITNGITFYFTAQLLYNNNSISFGQCGSLPYLHLEGTQLTAMIPTDTIPDYSVTIGTLNILEWFTAIVSAKNVGAKVSYFLSFKSQSASVIINGEIPNAQISSSTANTKCFLYKNIMTTIDIKSATFEDEYLTSTNFVTICSNSSICKTFNQIYCLFAPTKLGNFWKYNANSQAQCVCNGIDCATCRQNYYYVSTTHLCESCNVLCAECTAGDNSHCSKCNTSIALIQLFSPATCRCKTPFVLNHNQTMCICPPHTFLNQRDIACIDCYFMCDECYGNNPQNCIGCADIEGITQDSGGNCIILDGYFLAPGTSIIQKCHQTCFKCDGVTEEDCLDCSAGLVMSVLAGVCICDITNNFEYNSQLNRCVCKRQFYQSGDTCQSCGIECAECDREGDITFCKACMPNLVMINGECKCSRSYDYDGVSKCKLKVDVLVAIIIVAILGSAGIAVSTIFLIKHFRSRALALRNTQTNITAAI